MGRDLGARQVDEQRVVGSLVAARDAGLLGELARHVRARNDRHELPRILEQRQRHAASDAAGGRVLDDPRGQAAGGGVAFVVVVDAGQVGVLELVRAAEQLASHGVLVHRVAEAEPGAAGALGHAAELVVDERLPRPQRQQDLVEGVLGELVDEAPVLGEAPRLGAADEVVDQAPAARVQVRGAGAVAVGQAQRTGIVGQQVSAQQELHAPAAHQLVHRPQGGGRAAAGGQQVIATGGPREAPQGIALRVVRRRQAAAARVQPHAGRRLRRPGVDRRGDAEQVARVARQLGAGECRDGFGIRTGHDLQVGHGITSRGGSLGTDYTQLHVVRT